MSAAVMGDTAAMEVLLAEGADIGTTTGTDAWTLLMHAVRFGRAEMVRFLCDRGADIHATNKRGANALHYAAVYGHAEITSLFLDRGGELADYAYPGYLLMAIRSGHFDNVKTFLDKGADPNARDEMGNPALEYAVRVGGVEVGDEWIVRLLLERGADINGGGYDGRTALMEATRFGNVKMVTLLLEEGADVNASSRSGTTALMLAEKFHAAALEAQNAEQVARAEAVIDLLMRAGPKYGPNPTS